MGAEVNPAPNTSTRLIGPDMCYYLQCIDNSSKLPPSIVECFITYDASNSNDFALILGAKNTTTIIVSVTLPDIHCMGCENMGRLG